MSTWTSSLTQKPPRRQWFRLVLPFSSTFIMDQILHWEKFATTCSQGRRWQEWSNQRLYLQQRVQLHSMHSMPTCRPRDWIFLQSMSLNPSDYGWTLGVHGYEPVPTLDPMAPEGLLKFTSCNCHGDCSNRWCTPVDARRMGSCASQPVESAKALHAKTAVMMLLSLKKIDNDSWSIRHWGWGINNSEYYISMWNKSYFVYVKVSVAFFFQILGACCVWNIYMPTNQLKITKKTLMWPLISYLRPNFKKSIFQQSFIVTRTWAGFAMGAEFQHFKRCYYTSLQTYWSTKLYGIYNYFHHFPQCC